jgi:hypothetical protein
MSIAASFQTRLLCEDIRNELGNKRTLVGVFSGDIIVEKFPATLSLAAYFEYLPATIGEQRIDFLIRYDDAKLFDFGGVLSIEEPTKVVVLTLPRLNVTLAQAGELKIEVAIPPSSPETLLLKKVQTGAL